MRKVIITKAVPADLVAATLSGFEVIQGPDDAEWTQDQVIPHLKGCVGLVTWGFVRVDRRLLDRAPELRVVANIAVGIDNLDVEELTRRGIWATNVPGAFAAATAEVTMALIIGAMRRTSEGERYLRAGRWTKPQPGRFDGPTLVGKTLGLVGFGRVGREVARRALGFGMRILYFATRRAEPKVEDHLQARWRPFEELLAESDVISLHVPLTPQTLHLIDAQAIARMKPTAYLVNTSRGKVVDEKALIAALQEGRIAGAGLDVFEEEPSVPQELLELPNVMLTPHLGGAAVEARREAQRQALENVRRVLSGEAPHSPVNHPAPLGGER